MLVGSVIGGVVAQLSNLGVPFVLRAVLLLVALLAAFFFMRDQGFTPKKGISTVTAIRDVVRGSIDGGLRNRPVRWLMLAAPFTGGVGFYAFYAMQPYLLELYGDPNAYSIAGIAAAVFAGAQIVGGLSVPIIRRFFTRRTHVLILAVVLSSGLSRSHLINPSFMLSHGPHGRTMDHPTPPNPRTTPPTRSTRKTLERLPRSPQRSPLDPQNRSTLA